MDERKLLDICRFGSPEDLGTLKINSGDFSVNCFYDERYTLLGEAVRFGNLRVIKFLIELGADVDMCNETLAEDPPVKIALLNCQIDAFILLVRSGADCAKPGWMGIDTRELLYTMCNDRSDRYANITKDEFKKILLEEGIIDE